MIRFVYGKDEEVGDFVARLTGMPRGVWPGSKAIGVVNGDDLLAGVVYHHWSPEAGTIVMSGASTTPRWLTRLVLKRIFDYPFVECGCQMVIMQVQASDVRLLSQLAVIGFNRTTIARLYGRGKDGIIATLTAETWHECRFNRNAVELEEAA
jgi:hypothetical protein